jgi:hypothetical protein
MKKTFPKQKTFPKRAADRRPAPQPRLFRHVVMIDRARHEIGGEPRWVEAVKIALVDLDRRREVEVSYALRLEGFLSAAFSRKHEVVKALKEGDFDAFLKDLAPIPEASTAPDAPLASTSERPDAPHQAALAETEVVHAAVPISAAA